MTTSRFPNGMTTAAKTTALGQFILPDMTKVHSYFTDFDVFVRAKWTIVEDNSGTMALTDEDGGVLLGTTGNADGNAVSIFQKSDSFLMEVGKQTWYNVRYKTSAAKNESVMVGLANTAGLLPSDGIFFQSPDENSTISLHVRKNNNSNQVVVVKEGDAVDDTYIDLGFYYDGKTTVFAFVDDKLVARTDITNFPDDEALSIAAHFNNGTAGVKTANVDYIFASKER